MPQQLIRERGLTGSGRGCRDGAAASIYVSEGKYALRPKQFIQ